MPDTDYRTNPLYGQAILLMSKLSKEKRAIYEPLVEARFKKQWAEANPTVSDADRDYEKLQREYDKGRYEDAILKRGKPPKKEKTVAEMWGGTAKVPKEYQGYSNMLFNDFKEIKDDIPKPVKPEKEMTYPQKWDDVNNKIASGTATVDDFNYYIKAMEILGDTPVPNKIIQMRDELLKEKKTLKRPTEISPQKKPVTVDRPEWSLRGLGKTVEKGKYLSAIEAKGKKNAETANNLAWDIKTTPNNPENSRKIKELETLLVKNFGMTPELAGIKAEDMIKNTTAPKIESVKDGSIKEITQPELDVMRDPLGLFVGQPIVSPTGLREITQPELEQRRAMPEFGKPLQERYSQTVQQPTITTPPDSLAGKNKNPANVRKVGSTTEFQQFPTFEAGIIAAYKDIKAKQTGGDSTITNLGPNSPLAELISVWAPQADGNDVTLYIQQLVDWTGLPHNTPIGQIPTEVLVSAIIKKESGTNLSPEEIMAIVNKEAPLNTGKDVDPTRSLQDLFKGRM